MLRSLAIAIFVAAVLPIYGQNESSQPGNNQSHSYNTEKSHLPPRTATCVVRDDGNAIECIWAEDKPESYFKRLFSSENAPNIGLFVVGCGGVFAAIQTLRAIKKQAELMQQQNQMVLSKERARLYVGLDNFVPDQDENLLGYMVRGTVSIYGPTDAFIEKAELAATIGEVSEFVKSVPRTVYVADKVIHANSEPFKVMTSLMRSDSLLAGDEGIPEIINGDDFVYCVGEFVFQNLFDKRYVFRINKRFEFYRHEGKIIDKELGTWVDCGPPESNGEYEIKEPEKSKVRWYRRARAD
jgi:hypothetical protein